jgi:hypothetical protein
MLLISTHKKAKDRDKKNKKIYQIPAASMNHSIVSRISRIPPYQIDLAAYKRKMGE